MAASNTNADHKGFKISDVDEDTFQQYKAEPFKPMPQTTESFKYTVGAYTSEYEGTLTFRLENPATGFVMNPRLEAYVEMSLNQQPFTCEALANKKVPAPAKWNPTNGAFAYGKYKALGPDPSVIGITRQSEDETNTVLTPNGTSATYLVQNLSKGYPLVVMVPMNPSDRFRWRATVIKTGHTLNLDVSYVVDWVRTVKRMEQTLPVTVSAVKAAPTANEKQMSSLRTEIQQKNAEIVNMKEKFSSEKRAMQQEHEQRLEQIKIDGEGVRQESVELRQDVQDKDDLIQKYETVAQKHAKSLAGCRKDVAGAQQVLLSATEKHRLEIKAKMDQVDELSKQIALLQKDSTADDQLKAANGRTETALKDTAVLRRRLSEAQTSKTKIQAESKAVAQKHQDAAGALATQHKTELAAQAKILASQLLKVKITHEAELHALCSAAEMAQNNVDQLYQDVAKLYAENQKMETENKAFKSRLQNPALEKMYALAKKCEFDQVIAQLQTHPNAVFYKNPHSGWTLLHQAAWAGNERAVQTLIAKGSSKNVQDKKGMTPYQVAITNKSVQRSAKVISMLHV